MTTEKHIKLGRTIALISFLIGTIIFGLFYQTSNSDLIFIGYGFILIVGLINSIVFIAIRVKAGKDKENRKRLLITSKRMLLNIPVLIIYCWISVILLNTMRITFTNETGTTITDLNISGCGDGHIEKLEIGESKTIWIDIPSDCSIAINYLENGRRKGELVAGYVSSNSGQKAKHKINGKDKEIFL